MKYFDITEQKFCDILRQLKEADELKCEVDDLIRKHIPEGHDFLSGYGMSIDHECAVVDLLELLTHDKGELISWWCWEKDYGEREGFDAMDKDGDPIDLSTPELLYAFLLQEYNNDNDE